MTFIDNEHCVRGSIEVELEGVSARYTPCLNPIKQIKETIVPSFLIGAHFLSFGHTQPIADPKLIFSIRITKPP